MIKRQTIERVIYTANVVDVIDEFIHLKKSGANYSALSPFTNEKTPSFIVSPSKNIWKCFSSGKGGGALKFLMEHQRLSLPDAVKYLANKYNIEVEYENDSSKKQEEIDHREKLFHALEFYQILFQENLWNPQLNRRPMEYLKSRGFTDEAIKTFGLGYAIQARQVQYDKASRGGYKFEILEELGLVYYTEAGQTIDRFRDRIMFPVYTATGRPTGFGGRVIDSNTSAPKYINSSESQVYKKSRLLYGMYQARREIISKGLCYLVEGYTDVIKLYQKGIKNVVASAGTALTAEQIRLISNATKNIVLLFDSDSAGMSAALRSIDLILEQGLKVKICALPKGEDPDSFSSKYDREDIENYLTNNAVDFIDFKSINLGIDGTEDPVKKAEIIGEIVQSIAVVPNFIEREFYIKKTSKTFKLEERNLFDALAQQLSRNQRKETRKFTPEPPPLTADKNETEVSKNQDSLVIDVLSNCMNEILEDLVLYSSLEVEFDDIVNESSSSPPTLEKRIYKVYQKIDKTFQTENLKFRDPLDHNLYELLIDFCNKEGGLESQHLNDIGIENPDYTSRLAEIQMKYELHTLGDWSKYKVVVPTIEDGASTKVNDDLLNLQKLLIQGKIRDLESKIKELDSNSENEAYQSERGTEVLREIVQYNDLKTLISKKLERII